MFSQCIGCWKSFFTKRTLDGSIWTVGLLRSGKKEWRMSIGRGKMYLMLSESSVIVRFVSTITSIDRLLSIECSRHIWPLAEEWQLFNRNLKKEWGKWGRFLFIQWVLSPYLTFIFIIESHLCSELYMTFRFNLFRQRTSKKSCRICEIKRDCSSQLQKAWFLVVECWDKVRERKTSWNYVWKENGRNEILLCICMSAIYLPTSMSK